MNISQLLTCFTRIETIQKFSGMLHKLGCEENKQTLEFVREPVCGSVERDLTVLGWLVGRGPFIHFEEYGSEQILGQFVRKLAEGLDNKVLIFAQLVGHETFELFAQLFGDGFCTLGHGLDIVGAQIEQIGEHGAQHSYIAHNVLLSGLLNRSSSNMEIID